jgi:hypothetical protein
MLTPFFLRGCAPIAFAVFWLFAGTYGHAQDILKELEENEHHHGVDHADHKHGHDETPSGKKNPAAEGHAGHSEHKEQSGHRQAKDHSGHGQIKTHDAAHQGMEMRGGEHEMHGFLGPYPMNREGSGTSWLPDSTPHFGVHAMYGEWQTMYHALFNLVFDHQGGPRGGDKTFLNGMFMGMAQRPLGDGTWGFRAMLAPDPFMGANGYPLLLATGETANGRTPLIDRQHPHDLFMEMATTYSHDFAKNSSVYIYAGLPGEPALGPSAFMHRTSGMDIPEAPITHHWLDSTHITFGVVTAGVVLNTWKLEASAFRGREPDQYRYDIEAPKLDSYSGRISWNPIRELSLQVSWGHLQSPEQLEPERNEDRFTVSAIYTQTFGKDNVWSTTAAWGRKMQRPGDTLDGFILETAAIFEKTYTVFARAERVRENELLDLTPTPIHTVSKVSVGGIYDFYRTDHAKFGVGGLISLYGLPGDLRSVYGEPTSAMGFVRLKIE